ncbi:Rossmann-fold NAD(P)-binding domain-containing protein [Mucilaginibacter gilvus]|uniref:Uncharacterized protein n=1 Tax=Mucilaginibacter gilvus TaxID=2305909 RepID=A0A444MRU9_9SPHI|nr:hypothetical protein [Mucilaginibacter gilvus]RWY54348.1 hypothetical protein EPL05_09955 [Mucilaginibacter gilvus]
MKAVAYSVLDFEKEYFAKANKKKHDITLIANPLTVDTVHYAQGKEAIIMPEGFRIPEDITQKLCNMGINYIITRPAGADISNLQETAEQIIKDLDTANEDNRLLPAS